MALFVRPARWWRAWLLLVAAGAWGLCAPGAARAQLHVIPAAGEEARPITIHCDEAAAWTEQNLQVFLLRGGVSVEQGLLRARMNEAVVWMTLGEADQGKPVPVAIYGEGDVALDQAGTKSKEPRVFLDLHTRGEFRLRKRSLVNANQAADPFFLRAEAEVRRIRQGESAPPAAGNIQLAAAQPPPATDRTIEVVPEPERNAPPPPQGPPGAFNFSAVRPRRIQVEPRGGSGFTVNTIPGQNGETATIISGGVTIFVDNIDNVGVVDISTDRAVIWTRNVDAEQFMSGLRSGGRTTQEQIEVYLEGHVEIRQAAERGPDARFTQELRADQAYYDVQRNVALLRNGEVRVQQPGIPVPVYLRAEEIRQTAMNRFEASNAQLSISKLPSDPQFKILADQATVEQRTVPVRGLFGRTELDPQTGLPRSQTQLWATAQDVTFRFEDVPVAYLPSVAGNLQDPLGPLERIRFRTDRIFGPGILVDWDLFEILGAEPPERTRWRLDTDYLGYRGPALGTEFETAGRDLFGWQGPYASLFRFYGIYDHGTDVLSKIITEKPPREDRGQILFRHRQEIGENLTFLGQAWYISDRNFLEQYFKREWDETINQDTFAYLKYQEGDWALSLEGQPGLRWWMNQTEWLPRADGYLVGRSLFDSLTWFVHGSAGYANFHTTADIPSSYIDMPLLNPFGRDHMLPPSSDFPHNPDISLGRFDLWQELDLPIPLGPLKLVPYGIADGTFYTDDLTGDSAGRFYGGGGVRAALPFTRVYPDVQSQLFNLNGIAHKVTWVADYRWMTSNVNFRELPILDRPDDDTIDLVRRNLRMYRLSTYPPGTLNYLLATSPIYDQQLYDIRRGVTTLADTLDDVQYLNFGVQNRWQTKRGFPGRQHIIDWMSLDLSATWFPDADRDNFGNSFAFLEYRYAWHIGDRTTLLSDGWMDPFADGARVFNIGLYQERPERLRTYLGFRLIEPVGVDALIASATYLLSPKWAVSGAASYDFGQGQNLGNSLILTRIGSDLQVSLGFTWDPLSDNFGVGFEIVPSLAPGKNFRGTQGLYTQAGNRTWD